MTAKLQRRSSRFEMDMTTGPLLPKVLMFSLPLVITSVLQLLYNAADVIVVGRYAGAQSLAAVSSTGALINLLVNIFMGLSVGGSVVIARAYGAGDAREVHQGVHTSITVAGIAGVAVGIMGFFASRPMLQLMGSPDDVIDLASLYMRIFFLGMPFNMLYNFGAAVLRAVGDTRRPLYFLSISGVVNVLLNLLLVIVFKLDVAGVAIATVISQIISAVLVLLCLLRSEGSIRLNPRELRVYRQPLIDIVRVGLPAGLQGSLFSISNVLIQSSINSFGSIAMAGNGAASNLEGFVYVAMNAIHQAALTFASQNLGARKIDRVRRNMWVCLGTVTVIGLSMGLVMLAFGRPLITLYNDDAEVIRYGMLRMSYILPTYFFCGCMDVMVGQLRGIGYSIMPMIVSLTGACLLRVVWIYTVFALNPTLNTLYISYPISWALTFAVHLACYLYVAGHRLKVMQA